MTHDHLCRCRTCKPSLVADWEPEFITLRRMQAQRERIQHRRIEVACFVVAVLLFALLIFNTSVRPYW